MSNINSRTEEMGSGITQVWRHNVAKEFKRFVSAARKYNVISIDTEFAGVSPRSKTGSGGGSGACDPAGFLSMQQSLKKMKLIQLGLSLCNESGEKPSQHTWQFNFRFDMKSDPYQWYSIKMLKAAKTNMNHHKYRGIDARLFGERLLHTDIVRCSNIQWVCFHGSFDVGYLLSLVYDRIGTCSFTEYQEALNEFFPRIDDIKEIIMRGNTGFAPDLGLESMSKQLGCKRKGTAHQAGSDAELTSSIYQEFVRKHPSFEHLNRIHGYGKGSYGEKDLIYSEFCLEDMDAHDGHF